MIEALVVHSPEDREAARQIAANFALGQKVAFLSADTLSQFLHISPATLRIVLWTKALLDDEAYASSIEPFLANSNRMIVLQLDDTPVGKAIQMKAFVGSEQLGVDEFRAAVSRLPVDAVASAPLLGARMMKAEDDKTLVLGWTIFVSVVLIAVGVCAYVTQSSWQPFVQALLAR